MTISCACSDRRRHRSAKLRGEIPGNKLLIKGTNRKRIREALQEALASRPELQRRVVVDVDPLSVL